MHPVPEEGVSGTECLTNEDALPYHRRGFPIPNIPSVPEKPVFCTECLRKRAAYTRRPFLAPSELSVPEKALSGTEFFKLPEKGEHCLHRMQQTPERKRPFPVQCSEDAPRTRGGLFRYRISLPYHRSLFCAPSAPENAPRTPGSLFEHGTHIPYHRRPSPVPNFSNCQKRRALPAPNTTNARKEEALSCAVLFWKRVACTRGGPFLRRMPIAIVPAFWRRNSDGM